MMRVFLGLLLLLTGSAAAQNAVGLNTHLPSADELDAAAASGVTWICIDNNWINVERAEGRPDWAALNRVADGAVERGLSVYMTVACAPPWAHEPDGDDVPTNNVPRPGLYERYLRATVERYRDWVQHYQAADNSPVASRPLFFLLSRGVRNSSMILRNHFRIPALRSAKIGSRVLGPRFFRNLLWPVE
jgi:hypothetical protein